MGSTKTRNVQCRNAATENPECGTETPERETENQERETENRNAFLLICVIYRYCYKFICHHDRGMVTNFVYTYEENAHIAI